MNKIKAQIPNTITSLNLLCGTLSIYTASTGNFQLAALLILCGAFFDFFDGFSARLLNVKSNIGKELDSLADLITFGAAPAFMLLFLLKENLITYQSNILFHSFIVFTPLILVVFSALRLAKFNVDTRQTKEFLGLPTPANAIFWISFVFMYKQNIVSFPEILVFGLILIFCILLVIDFPMFSLKSLSKKELIFPGVLLIISIPAIIVLKLQAGVIIILSYILISIIRNIINKK